MKRMITLILFCLIGSPVFLQAQEIEAAIDRSSDQEFREFLREKQKPSLVQKLKLTKTEADKVIEVQVWAAPYLLSFAKLPAAQQAEKIRQLNEGKEKKYREIPLTDEKVKAVIAFYEQMLREKTWPTGDKNTAYQ